MSIVNLKSVKKYLTLLTVGLIVSCTGASYPSNHAQAKEKSSFMTTSLKKQHQTLKGMYLMKIINVLKHLKKANC